MSPKIIFVNRVYPPSEAATAQLLGDLSIALASRGWNVHVVTTGPATRDYHGVVVHGTGEATTRTGLGHRALNYTSFLHSARSQVRRLASQGDVVVLMTDPPLLAAVCTGVARRRRAHVVQWIQDVYPEVATHHLGRWSTPLMWPLAFARNRAWTASDRCVVVGSDMRAAVASAGVAAARTLVMYNWAPRELDAAAEPTSPDAIRASWGLADEFVVAYSGNLGRVHEFDTFLDAAEQLRDNAAIAFAIIGAGPRRAEVEREVKSRGLRKVRFHPPQPREKLAASLAAADVHLVTLREGFHRWVNPSKLQGILAAARPVLFVGPHESAIAALLAREGCGRTFALGAGRELANEIERLAAEPAAKSALGRAARVAYERYFSFDAAIACWEEMLRRIAG